MWGDVEKRGFGPCESEDKRALWDWSIGSVYPVRGEGSVLEGRGLLGAIAVWSARVLSIEGEGIVEWGF